MKAIAIEPGEIGEYKGATGVQLFRHLTTAKRHIAEMLLPDPLVRRHFQTAKPVVMAFDTMGEHPRDILPVMNGLKQYFYSSDALDPVLMQIEPGDSLTEFALFTGERLYSIKGDPFSGGLNVRDGYMDIRKGTIRHKDCHVDDMSLNTQELQKAFLAWGAYEAMRWNPEDGAVQHVMASRHLVGNKNIPVCAIDIFKVPSLDVLAGMATRAHSNKQEITKMGHAFQRTTLNRGEDGRDRSGYKIRCTKCGAEDEIAASGHTGSLPQTVLNKKFQQKGWKTGRKCVCPACQQPKTAEIIEMRNAPVPPRKPEPEYPAVTADPPRQMTASDKRKVFRAIDDAWDESKGRYTGRNSDAHIADDLDVPRAWVREIREENFGKTHRNEDLDKVMGEAKNLRAEAARNAASALDLATKFEKLDQAYQDLIRRLEAVE